MYESLRCSTDTITALFVNRLYPKTKKEKKTKNTLNLFQLFLFIFSSLCSFFPPLSFLVSYRVQKTNNTGLNLSLQTNALKASTSQHIAPQGVLRLSRPSRAQQRSGLLPVATLGVSLKLEAPSSHLHKETMACPGLSHLSLQKARREKAAQEALRGPRAG